MNPSKKIRSLHEVSKIVKDLKRKRKTTGLITGCFDILHIGHIDMFQFAKKHVDVLVVGVDNDESIRLSKGNNRPIYSLRQRERVLSELSSVDLIFPIREVFSFNSLKAEKAQERIGQILKPNALITNPSADRFWEKKEIRARKIGVRLLKCRKRVSSVTKIIQKLESEM